MPAVDYFFSMSSPYAYLGHAAFMALAREHGVEVAFRPLPLARLFPETGGLPLAKRHPQRQRYRWLELQRWRARRQLPLNLQPAFSPYDPGLVDRVVIAAVLAGHDPDPLMRRVFAGVWAEDRDLADAGTIRALLEEVGLPAGALLAAAEGAEAAAVYDANLQAGIEACVFGAPTYVLAGEAFWGQDRLDLLAEALAEKRPPYRASPI